MTEDDPEQGARQNRLQARWSAFSDRHFFEDTIKRHSGSLGATALPHPGRSGANQPTGSHVLIEFRSTLSDQQKNFLSRAEFVSATLENEADPTLENEATGSCLLVCRVLGSDAGQGVDSAVA